jgi:hypothetical protein
MNIVTKPPGEAQDAPLYVPTDMTPEELFEALGRLRNEAENEIERLIDLLDLTDPYFDEREGRTDDEDCDDDSDDEPVLGSCEEHPNPLNMSFSGYSSRGSQIDWAGGNGDDREGDGCADDREGDELMHGGESVHEDDEASLGWTDAESAGGRAPAGTMGYNKSDYEEAPSTVTPAARVRYRKSDRYATNTDGWHVDSGGMFGPRRILNLSDRQRAILRPKVDRGAVSI